MTSPTQTPIRLTITVDPRVHAAFRRFADASGMSIGRAMGEWLGDTVEAAEFMADKMEQARAAPRLVLRELHAYSLGLSEELSGVITKMRDKPGAGTGAEASAPRLAARQVSPPSSNTGGKGRKTVGRGMS